MDPVSSLHCCHNLAKI
uniref:Uncharacterized protein n=1 Tax=Rhizophora mucronata TaxID=61149 RepID=A0A2P2J355_RHIMU